MYIRIALVALTTLSLAMPAMADTKQPKTSTTCDAHTCCTTTVTDFTTYVVCVPRASAVVASPGRLLSRQ